MKLEVFHHGELSNLFWAHYTSSFLHVRITSTTFNIIIGTIIVIYPRLCDTGYRRGENLLSSVSQEATAIQVLTEETKHLTHNGLWNYLMCEEIFASDRPVHSAQTWNHARQVYTQIIGHGQSFIDKREDEETISNGFRVAYDVKQVPPKGRGIFAAQDIQKGQLIWSTKKTARFSDGDSFRKFTLSLERGFACDVLNVSYVQRLENGELQISTDLDDGSLCNGEDEDNDANMGCVKMLRRIMKVIVLRITLY